MDESEKKLRKEKDKKSSKKHKRKRRHSDSSDSPSSSDPESESASSESSSDSSSSASSSTSSSEEHHRKRHRKKKKKEEKKKKQKEKEKKKKKKEKKDKKRKRKEKGGDDAKNAAKKGPVRGYGAYGIVTQADMWRKKEEFEAWLNEVKKVASEGLSNFELKKHWVDFMEDYNTATMPSDKYYDLNAWEITQVAAKNAALRAAAGLPKEDVRTEFNDEEDVRRQRKLEREQKAKAEYSAHVAELKAQAAERERGSLMRILGSVVPPK